MEAVRKAGRLWTNDEGRGIQLREWLKPGWTYHAKGEGTRSLPATSTHDLLSGIWLSPDATSPPILTLFGSTNLNSRSAQIDTELSFLMIVPSESRPEDAGKFADALELRGRLAAEVAEIRANTSAWQGASRKVRFWTKRIVGLVHNML